MPFVKIDGFVGVFRTAADLKFLGIVMAHHVVVIDFGGNSPPRLWRRRRALLRRMLRMNL